MRTLFLTSNFSLVADAIEAHISATEKILFVTTASETYEGSTPWVDADRAKLIAAGHKMTDFTFTGASTKEVQRAFDTADCVFVEGGNTYFLLQEVRRSGAADVIGRFIERGGIYIGCSAGSIIACPTIGWTGWLDDPSEAPDLKDMEGLGLVPFLILPHWGGERYAKRQLEHNLPLIQKEPHPAILLQDSQYIQVSGDTFSIRDVSNL